MLEGMKSEFLAAFRAEFGFGEMTATANDDAAAMLKAAAWAWQASRESARVSAISPEVSALMQRIDDEERGQALLAEAFVRESGRARSPPFSGISRSLMGLLAGLWIGWFLTGL